MATPMTLEEIMRPIEAVTCGRCGRKDCVIYPSFENVAFSPPRLGKGVLFCPTCSTPKEIDERPI